MARHYEEARRISASPAAVFALIDDHSRLSAHMTKPSWMTGGGTMAISTDAGDGRKVGSHIRLNGHAFGIELALDEVVTSRDPPHTKAWETVGEPKLLIIGRYGMRVDVVPAEGGSLLRVGIDYDLPTRASVLGSLFGEGYAKWCVRRMLRDAVTHFAVGVRPAALA